MTRKEKFYNIINRNKKYLKNLGIVRIGIFGSLVRNEDIENSDYDILVEFKKESKSFKNFMNLCDFIENNLTKNYDLITRDSLSPYIGSYILKEVENVQIAS